MIKSIHIKNFRSHKDTRIDLSEGVNLIVGESMAGKSAILGAFEWVAYNKPLGFNYNSWFSKGKPTKVSITVVEDGVEYIITKTKDEEDASYKIINKKTGERKFFRKFRTNVPDEVVKLLNIQSVNIQKQLDQFFLILSNPSEIAKQINRVLHTEKVDEEWIPKITKRIGKVRGEINTFRKDQEIDRERLKEFDSIDNVKVLYHKMRKLTGKIKDLEKLVSLLDKWYDENTEIERIARAIEGENRVKECSAIVEEIQSLKDSIDMMKRYVKIAAEIEFCSKVISYEDFLKKLTKKAKRVERLDDKTNDFFDILADRDDLETDYRKTIKKLEVLLRGNKKCPVCFSSISDKVVEEVISCYSL